MKLTKKIVVNYSKIVRFLIKLIVVDNDITFFNYMPPKSNGTIIYPITTR